MICYFSVVREVKLVNLFNFTLNKLLIGIGDSEILGRLFIIRENHKIYICDQDGGFLSLLCL